MEAPPLSSGTATGHVAASKRGLQTSLKERARTVILMLDETIVTETPPLYARYGPVGGQTEMPISGNHRKRILHGAIHTATGIEICWLPRATPELNAMDQLWKHVKANALANQPKQSIDRSAEVACQ